MVVHSSTQQIQIFPSNNTFNCNTMCLYYQLYSEKYYTDWFLDLDARKGNKSSTGENQNKGDGGENLQKYIYLNHVTKEYQVEITVFLRLFKS